MGICLRGDQGNFIKARSLLYLDCLREAEDWAFLQTLHWMTNIRVSNVIFVLDCQIVGVKTPSHDSLDFHCVLCMCRVILQHFSNSMMSFIRGQVNHIVHMS